MRRFFIDTPALSGTVTLTGDEARHILRVLRLKKGAEILVFDRQGTACTGVIAGKGTDEVTVRITEIHAPAQESRCEIVLAQAVLKSQKMDLVVQKATELGVSRIVPFISSRCIPRWDADKAAQKQHHWQQVAVAAVKQSGVRPVPAVDGVAGFEEMLQEPFEGWLKVFLWEEERRTRLRELIASHKPLRQIVFVVGPEGGFPENEAALARRHGFVTAGLGDTILRAETAPLVVLAILGYETGSLG